MDIRLFGEKIRTRIGRNHPNAISSLAPLSSLHRSTMSGFQIRPWIESFRLPGQTSAKKNVYGPRLNWHTQKKSNQNTSPAIRFGWCQGVLPKRANQIKYISSDHIYVVIHTSNSGEITLRMSLTDVEGLLDNTTFIRCHRSFIVNKVIFPLVRYPFLCHWWDHYTHQQIQQVRGKKLMIEPD